MRPSLHHLLDIARTQWQFGDWASLADLEQITLEHDEDRAELALLAAAGHLQFGHLDEARHFIDLALGWGASKAFVSQIMISGVHNSLGRATAISGLQHKSKLHFEKAMVIGTSTSSPGLLIRARTAEQLNQLGLPSLEGNQKSNDGKSALGEFTTSGHHPAGRLYPIDRVTQAWLSGRWRDLAKLDNADMTTYANRAELALYAACGYQQLDDADGLARCTRLAKEWGCPIDMLKKYLAAGVYNTFAIGNYIAGQYESAVKNFFSSLSVGQNKPTKEIVLTRIRNQFTSNNGFDADLALGTLEKLL